MRFPAQADQLSTRVYPAEPYGLGPVSWRIAMQQRRRSKPHSFVDQLEAEKARITARLKTARGPKRDELIQKISQIETAIQVNDWLSSPVLKMLR